MSLFSDPCHNSASLLMWEYTQVAYDTAEICSLSQHDRDSTFFSFVKIARYASSSRILNLSFSMFSTRY